MKYIDPSVSAVVVTWNSVADIETCLGSLLAQSHPLKKIIVVDNNSSDRTPDFIREHFPTVNLIALNENCGFASGNNIGIAECDSDWVLTLNPDAYLDTEWIERLLKFAGENSRIGTLTGKLYREGDTNPEAVIDSVGIEIFRSRRVRDRGFSEMERGQYPNAEIVFGACAAAALYRTKMLNDTMINGEVFPERFFCYYEDADLAWRAWRTGWECWYVPQALGWHKRGASPVGSKFSRYMTHRNRLWLILRNESIWQTITAQPELCLHELLMFLRVLRYPYLLVAVLESILGFKRALDDRKRIISNNLKDPPYRQGIGFK